MATKEKERPRAHFIGIGGIGMSALARYFLSEGWRVSGSDLSPSPTTNELKKERVAIRTGKHSANILQKFSPTLVVYNQAIPETNPELTAAKKMGLAVRSYPEMVGELTKKYKTIAIAGAHGKSTTTAMTALILIEAGFDPTVIIGTKLKQLGGKNFRKGKNAWLVLEADEFGGAFLNYSPYAATITNIDKEHLDFYKNFANVRKTFEKFKERCQRVVIAPNDAKLTAEIRRVLQVPGEHNVKNALNAYALASYLGIPKQMILRALAKYSGAWRRMDYRGKLGKALVFDDYAHHPTEIKATLAAFRQKWPKNALICVFQPHQADRLRRLFSDFKGAFKAADRVLILPEYKVAGREERFDKKYNAAALARAAGAVYVADPDKDLKNLLKKVGLDQSPSPIIVMMGAGDIVNYTSKLIS